MTYRELAQKIEALLEYQKDCNVTIYNADIEEYIPVQYGAYEDDLMGTDVLDKGHPYLVINDPSFIDQD